MFAWSEVPGALYVLSLQGDDGQALALVTEATTAVFGDIAGHAGASLPPGTALEWGVIAITSGSVAETVSSGTLRPQGDYGQSTSGFRHCTTAL